MPTLDELRLEEQHVMGIALPKIALQLDSTNKTHFGVSTTTGNADKSTRFFMQLLPLLAELAELENSVMRLARELRKTQRRCNALSRVFIPEHSKTIDYISATLEERERESFIVLRMIKERLSPTTVTNNGGANE